MTNRLVLYGANGEELALSNGHAPRGKASLDTRFRVTDFGSWQTALTSIGLSPRVRARDPFGNHPWVFAAAMTIASVASEAPYQILRETEAFAAQRDIFSRRHYGMADIRRHGRGRRALQRHLHVGHTRRLISKALEPDLQHPLNEVFLKPNPYQTGNQLFQLTHLWMAVRGEVFWVLEDENGESVMPGQIPARIWPLSPDLFQPILEFGSYGDLVGWYFYPPAIMAKRLQGHRIELPLTDVVQFKTPNPNDPLRGLSRIGAVALTVMTDMLGKDYNRSILEHGGDPGGVITYDSTLEKEEEDEYLKKWGQTHEGTSNARRTALLSGGFKYTPIALAPKDMEFLKAAEWNREEILAVMGVPSSVLGAKDVANYAVALANDLTFWQKTILPLLGNEEDTIDGSLMHEQPDSVMGAFNLKQVDALRAGLNDKLTTAKGFAGSELHMPPKTTFELVGLEVPEYVGDDVALVPPLLTPVNDIINPPSIFGPGVPSDVGGIPGITTPSSPVLPNTTPTPPSGAPGSSLFAPTLARHRIVRAKNARWTAFVKVQSKLEKLMAARYQKWIRADRARFLAAFDEATKGAFIHSAIVKATGAEILQKLPPIKGSKDALKAVIRPVYTESLDHTFNFTLDDLGTMPVFGIDAPAIVSYFDKRERAFVNNVPETIRKNLVNTLSEGIKDGETVQQLRLRVAQVYDISSGSSKTLQIARTESASFMNGVRDVMFEEQGFTVEDWSTAQDEHVRESHVLYGEEGPTPDEFNYLELSGNTAAGILNFPGDTRCTDASELINCRCLKLPVK